MNNAPYRNHIKYGAIANHWDSLANTFDLVEVDRSPFNPNKGRKNQILLIRNSYKR